MAASKKSSRSISENPSKDALKATKKKNNPPKHVEFAEPTSKAHSKKKSESKLILSGFEEGDTDGDSSEEEEDADDGEDEEDEDKEDEEEDEEADGDDSSDEGSDQSADDNLQPQPGSKDSRAPNRKSKRKVSHLTSTS